ncbi:MAG: hypothetical protein QMC17_01710, partial [Paracoccaceae bacterium]
MPDLNNSYKPRATALQVLGVRLWPLAYLGLVGLILSPLVSICVISLSGKDNIWPHLLATVLPRYMINSAYLMVFVGLFAVVTGTVTAWLLKMYRFPAKRFFDFALLFPLAIPAYVSAYALVDFLDYAGPVQSLLRGLMGWQSAQDYWFFQTRSRGGAAFVMGMA